MVNFANDFENASVYRGKKLRLLNLGRVRSNEDVQYLF